MPDDRLIIALDLDNFYVGVERLLNPALISRPVGIKQKGILATCSYEARAKGVGKLMGLRDAKLKCAYIKRGPEMIIVDGSDLTNYRAHSTQVFRLARTVLGPTIAVEKLGMDELFLDVTSLVRAHVGGLAEPDAKRDGQGRVWFPLEGVEGFWYEAGTYAGHLLPSAFTSDELAGADSNIVGRESETQAASHLATHLRALILRRIGLTSSAGVAPSKLMSKLLASVNKPADQTTLAADAPPAAVRAFLGPLELRKLPGFGSSVVGSLLPILPPELDGSVPTRASVSIVRDALTLADFQKLYSARLAPFLHGLLFGIDDSPVVPSPEFPAQISTEDSFATLINHKGGLSWNDFVGHLRRLLTNLLIRLEDELRLPIGLSTDGVKGKGREHHWARYPQMLRLSLRRSWDAPPSARASRSVPIPAGVFDEMTSVSKRVSDLFGGPTAKDGIGGLVGGLVRTLLGKEWARDGLKVYVINWAATSLSTTPPPAPNQTLSSFLAGPATARPAKRKVPADLDLAMLRSLPADVRAEVLVELGLSNVDLIAAEEDEQKLKRVKASQTGSSAPGSEIEVIDLTDETDNDELWEQWPAEAFAGSSNTVSGLPQESLVQCPVCDERLFPFALQAHLAFHDS